MSGKTEAGCPGGADPEDVGGVTQRALVPLSCNDASAKVPSPRAVTPFPLATPPVAAAFPVQLQEHRMRVS